MTEDEAKTKWCPFVRVDSTASNRVAFDEFSANDDPCCIGSACMAWRSKERQVERVQTGLGQLPVPYERFEREGWRQVDRPYRGADGLFYERTISEATGYCGLAGAPSS